jgi:hypothetical protein
MTPHPRVLSLDDAAMYCGISPSTLKRRGPDPIRIGRRCLWRIADLDGWLGGMSAGNAANDEEARIIAAIGRR